MVFRSIQREEEIQNNKITKKDKNQDEIKNMKVIAKQNIKTKKEAK